MSTQRYSVATHPVETLLTWVKSGEIAIPEIQRPFARQNIRVKITIFLSPNSTGAVFRAFRGRPLQPTANLPTPSLLSIDQPL